MGALYVELPPDLLPDRPGVRRGLAILEASVAYRLAGVGARLRESAAFAKLCKEQRDATRLMLEEARAALAQLMGQAAGAEEEAARTERLAVSSLAPPPPPPEPMMLSEEAALPSPRPPPPPLQPLPRRRRRKKWMWRPPPPSPPSRPQAVVRGSRRPSEAWNWWRCPWTCWRRQAAAPRPVRPGAGGPQRARRSRLRAPRLRAARAWAGSGRRGSA
mmetsp:Transcript_104182/g.271276  ORF Transcript_104182/g.271276 Transcript_104182/m.271276 type:complete len:217 (-) Transcript_104182:281-931(-)